MSAYDKFTDYLSTWFISDADIQTHKDVAASQAVIAQNLYDEGKIGFIKNWQLQNEIKGAGNILADYRAANDNPFAVIPWWVYVAAIGALFWYLGGFTWLRGILARK